MKNKYEKLAIEMCRKKKINLIFGKLRGAKGMCSFNVPVIICPPIKDRFDLLVFCHEYIHLIDRDQIHDMLETIVHGKAVELLDSKLRKLENEK